MMMMLINVLLLAILSLANADIYMQNPRGSNNRLNENGRERRNANRMFDSQNNNRGGYNVGNLYYFGGSVLPIQWTNQHSCADPNNNCEIVIQYMCSNLIRDGVYTNTIPDNYHACINKDCAKDLRFGMHEDYKYYENCKDRMRNKGLFTAEQNLKGPSARYTRQNPQGTRRGYECPEERDYYPYWQPTPWKDIVIMTNDEAKCSYYKSESQNVKSKFACEVPDNYLYDSRWGHRNRRHNRYIPITKQECEKVEGGKWKEYPAHGIPAPDCKKSTWSRDNHNGNGVGGFMNIYNWTVPDIQENGCAMRIRYNISTNDFDSWKTFSDKNGDDVSRVDISNLVSLSEAEAKSRGYVFKNNPQVEILKNSDKLKLQLAINTAQYGRTFQDRSHVFEIRKSTAELKGKNIFNLNVRGKRGNIVQVYPAVEYDFVPNTLTMKPGDYVHFQWTGSNTNPGNNDGQGRHGTDRSNVVLLRKQVYPEGNAKPSDYYGQYGMNYPQNLTKEQILNFDFSEVSSLAYIQPGAGDELNEAGTYFDLGPQKVTSTGIYHYMSTRNNNFSNRSQKGKIIVKNASTNDEVESTAESDEVKEEVARENEWSASGTFENSKKPDAKKKPKSEEVAFDPWEAQENKKDDTENENSPAAKNVEKQLDQQPWAKSVDLSNSQQRPHRAVRVEEVSKADGEEMLRKSGGFITKDDDYASDFMAVYPMKVFPAADSHLSVDLKLKKDMDPEYVTVYHSPDMKAWYPVENQDIQDGKARIKLESGGLYVARVRRTEADSTNKEMSDFEKYFDASQ